MAQGIIDVLEAVQIQKEHRKRSILAASQGNRLSDPVVEEHTIGQIREYIVLRGVSHLVRHGPRRAHIMENDHGSNNPPAAVVDRGGGIFNGGFKTVAADEDAVQSESDSSVLLNRHLHRISSGLARIAINNLEHFGEWFPDSFFAAPAGHSLGNEIEIGHATGNIGA